jgi:hypothetical protein
LKNIQVSYQIQILFLICTELSGVGRPKPADTNNALDIGQAGHLLVSVVLKQPIPIIIFGIGWKQPILKRPPFRIV